MDYRTAIRQNTNKPHLSFTELAQIIVGLSGDERPDGTIEIDNAGSYDTAKGTVTLTGFTPTAFEGSEIVIEAAPANQSTVRPLRNYILDIDPTSASVALLDFQNTAVTL